MSTNPNSGSNVSRSLFRKEHLIYPAIIVVIGATLAWAKDMISPSNSSPSITNNTDNRITVFLPEDQKQKTKKPDSGPVDADVPTREKESVSLKRNSISQSDEKVDNSKAIVPDNAIIAADKRQEQSSSQLPEYELKMSDNRTDIPYYSDNLIINNRVSPAGFLSPETAINALNIPPQLNATCYYFSFFDRSLNRHTKGWIKLDDIKLKTH